jgi:hypothetical protein
MAAPKGNKYAVGNKGGHPSIYDFEMCKEICKRVAMGEHIKAVLDSSDHYPDYSTWCNWKRDNQELFDLYTKAIQDKAEMVTFEINQTMQDMRDGIIEAPVGRILIDTLKWYASKFYPRMFGERVDITTDGDKINQAAAINLAIDGKVVDLGLKK